ncbi:hypothetical protein GUITHDRAFT_164190 [Guillardia theta CCMP2712]|uniref:Uncharacterized protein n=1 Tax=Guillardia theta (strain CCMP2712) TaxID=905079 RepID=L1J0Z6_GUITC|nr:hypothetical protein GUITHDRAFT_164190 [Guillardia theta CCMP2712]EKX42203.1 hypothetical protein GUITHDRAFT_164190 [Guillardia theta CCMP2712]|mmetsp:Transcript_2922/g.9851  ORF Transcript_2922/g.9851 Transcript_2922/m.9851 type:complete len:525 (-) Transcript_2922:204-1778(-)|eukprot:XP_005829183.1 hypothetical protein GUITHDRAFT_164190 [Guillardia theta CCMP2712]
MALSHDREYEDGEGFFQPPTSIWEQIKEKLHPSEIQEVSSILGQSLIDKNKELHDEIKSLLMILEDYVKEVDQREKQRNWNVQLGRDSNKDFLASEIRDFISALRSQTSTPISLRPKSAKDRSVLSFVMPDCYHEDELPSARKLLSSRGQSRGGRDGQASQEERNRPMTADLLGSLTRQAAAEHDKFSLETVECLSERFREILSLEEKDLLDQIDFLHSCIEAEQERDNKNMCTDMLPTERDLKDLRDRLQVELSITAAESRKQMRSKTLFPLARSLKPVSDLPAPPLAPPLPLPVPPFNQLEGPTQDTPGPPPPIPRAELGIDSDEERFLFGDDSEEEEDGSAKEAVAEEERKSNVDILVLDHEEEQLVDAAPAHEEESHRSRREGIVLPVQQQPGELPTVTQDVSMTSLGGSGLQEEEGKSRRSSVRSRHRRLIEDARANAALVSSLSAEGEDEGEDGGGRGVGGGNGRGGGSAPTPPKAARPVDRMRPAYARPSTMTRRDKSDAPGGEKRREEVDGVRRQG